MSPNPLPGIQANPSPGRRRAAAPGGILIVVLWLVFLLGAFALGLRARVSGRIRAAEWIQRQAAAWTAARSGLAAAQAVVHQIGTNAWHAWGDGWADDPARFRSIPVPPGAFSLIVPESHPPRFGLDDETGKLNLNALPQTPEGFAILRELLIESGLPDRVEAGDLAAAIFDWRDGSNGVFRVEDATGAEADHYLALSPPYRPHDGPFKQVEELLWVRGMDTGRFERLRGQITIYGTTAAVNINTAPRPVLLALARSRGAPPIAENLVRSIEYRRTGAPVFTNQLAILAALQKDLKGPEWALLNAIYPLLTTRSTHFRATCEGFDRPGATQAVCRLQAVIDHTGTLLEWRER